MNKNTIVAFKLGGTIKEYLLESHTGLKTLQYSNTSKEAK